MCGFLMNVADQDQKSRLRSIQLYDSQKLHLWRQEIYVHTLDSLGHRILGGKYDKWEDHWGISRRERVNWGTSRQRKHVWWSPERKSIKSALGFSTEANITALELSVHQAPWELGYAKNPSFPVPPQRCRVLPLVAEMGTTQARELPLLPVCRTNMRWLWHPSILKSDQSPLLELY